MAEYIRYSGNVIPRVPSTAPLSLRLSNEVYALDGCTTGPEIHPPNGPHYHEVHCDTSVVDGHKHSLGAVDPRIGAADIHLDQLSTAELKKAIVVYTATAGNVKDPGAKKAMLTLASRAQVLLKKRMIKRNIMIAAGIGGLGVLYWIKKGKK